MDVAGLVNKTKLGDKEALIQLVMEKNREYYRLAYVYTENKEDSLDAIQDMIVVLYENIRKLKDHGAFYSWSKTILVNCCKGILRKRNKFIFLKDYQEKEYIENFQSREQKQDILGCLKVLNKHQQEAIKLKYFMDMDNETISVLTKVPLGTVKSRIFTGLAKLKELFGGEY